MTELQQIVAKLTSSRDQLMTFLLDQLVDVEDKGMFCESIGSYVQYLESVGCHFVAGLVAIGFEEVARAYLERMSDEQK